MLLFKQPIIRQLLWQMTKSKLHLREWIGTYSPGGTWQTYLSELKKLPADKQENKWWGEKMQCWHFQGWAMKYLMAQDLGRLMVHFILFNFTRSNCIVLLALECAQPFENKAGISASFTQSMIQKVLKENLLMFLCCSSSTDCRETEQGEAFKL